MEYWLLDAQSGNAQGCYPSLDEALHAAEIELDGQPNSTFSLLAMRSGKRDPQTKRRPEPKRRVSVRFDLDVTQE